MINVVLFLIFSQTDELFWKFIGKLDKEILNYHPGVEMKK